VNLTGRARPMEMYALIVAGGSGSRMGTRIPKQFIGIAGRPILMHTVERFRSFSASVKIIIVLPPNQIDYWKSLCRDHAFEIPHSVAAGGTTRFQSVKAGLELVGPDGIVAIHDGVRPLVSRETLQRCFEAAAESGNAIPVISPSDSLRILTAGGSTPVDRDNIKIIQTPQVFDIRLIRKAYQQEYNAAFTDDATVFEKEGGTIRLVAGNMENIKITTPEDLIICEALLPLIS